MKRRRTNDRDALIYYCSGRKRKADKAISEGLTRRFSTSLGPRARKMLRKGRKLAFQRPGTRIDRASAPIRGIELYIGHAWKPRLKRALRDLQSHGVRCLVFSGGYGFADILELLHEYGASIKKTAPVWRPLLGHLLADYIKHHRIRRLFIVCSRDYERVLRSSQTIWMKHLRVVYWHVPHVPKGTGHHYTKVPRLARKAVIALALKRRPDRRWKRETPARL